MITPVVLPANQPATFYRGSGRLAEFRGVALPDRPEDWVASTTHRYRDPVAGLTVLPDGPTLLDAIGADPMSWTGSRDPDIGVLVKLLDAGQRLPLHVHPDRTFARAHLASPYGKTEAWHIVDAADDAYVHIGFARDVAAEELAGWVAAQDVATMLAATNRVPVRAGDTVLCPAGTPHAIGAGILLIELQEPTDWSIMLETEGFAIDPGAATLGLSSEVALSCVRRGATSAEMLERWRTPGPSSLLPAEAAPFFRAESLAPDETFSGFAIVVVTSGAGSLMGDWGALEVGRGSTVVVPFTSGATRLTGSAAGVLCRGAASRSAG